MRLNKAQTRVLVDRKYIFYNYLGYALRSGIPIAYLSIRYNLFNFQNTTIVTSWGVIAIIILVSTFWSKLKEVIKDYNTYLGKIGERAKMPIAFTIASVVLLVAYVSIQLLLGVFGFLALGGFVSLIPFSAYDVQHEKALRYTEELKIENQKNDLQILKQLKQKKTA
jgi:hypothetical protein